MNPLDLLRRARLRAILGRHLLNGGAVWRGYRRGTPMPPLRFRDGTTFLHGPGDAPVFLFFEIFANGCYLRRLEPGAPRVIADIGANIGAFTLDCARRFPSATIHAYEPNAAACATLRRNVAANGLEARVRLYPDAVGRACGTLRLWGTTDSLAGSGYVSSRTAPGVDVPMVDFATVLERAGGDIDVVKIDAEGAEADILEGGRGLLRQAREYVGEYHEGLVPGVFDRCRAALSREGFVFAGGCTRRCGPQFHARRM